MLRHSEWEVQNGPIPKNGVLPLTTLFFLKKINLSITTSLMYELPKAI